MARVDHTCSFDSRSRRKQSVVVVSRAAAMSEMRGAAVQLSTGIDEESPSPESPRNTKGLHRYTVVAALVIFIGLMTVVVGAVREKHKLRREAYLDARLQKHLHLENSTAADSPLVGLAAWWRFDKDQLQNNHFQDSSKHQRHAFAEAHSTPEFVKGPGGCGQAVRFRSTNRARLTVPIAGDLATRFSLVVWVNVEHKRHWQTIIAYSVPGAGPGAAFGLRLIDGAIALDFQKADSHTSPALPALRLKQHKWHHVVYTYDAHHNKVSVYRNGDLVMARPLKNTQQCLHGVCSQGIGPLWLGGDVDQEHWLDGELAEARVYTGVELTKKQVKKLYKDSKPSC